MVKLEKVVKSHDPEKKLDAVFTTDSGRKKVVPFGQAGARDYLKTGDTLRRQHYITRHRARENWDDPMSPGALSRFLLWGESTSLVTNLAAYRRRFHV
jgi:hypothetical protein